MTKEVVFHQMQVLQKMYCCGIKELSKHAPQYVSALHAFIAAAVAFSASGLDCNELHVQLDLNGITAADDMDFITSITADAMNLILDKYSYVLTPELLSDGYIAPLYRLRRAIVEHGAISS